MSTKNPTIKRILKEAAELANQPSSEYHAAPLESDLFEWHFTLRGPPAPSPYDGGIYHGRIILPPAYPLKPPMFRFLTPTGRFEVNREICLSISGHHEETWQPAWGIRTALVAIRSFMDTDAHGQLGGMDASDEVRKRFAQQSKASKCPTCGNTNEQIMIEHEATVAKQEAGGKQRKLDEVPAELRLAYREDVGKSGSEPESELKPAKLVESKHTQHEDDRPDVAQASERSEAVSSSVVATAPSNATTRPVVAPQPQQAQVAHAGLPEWIDKAIWGIAVALVFLVWKRFIL